MGTGTVQVAAEEVKPELASTTVSKGKFSGTVKWFNNAKGYGFIIADPVDSDANISESDGPNQDMFAHYSSINMEGYKSLKSGQSVLFDTKQADNGTHAINISPLHDEEHTDTEAQNRSTE